MCWSLIQGLAAAGSSVAQGLGLRGCVFNLEESKCHGGTEGWVRRLGVQCCFASPRHCSFLRL